MSVNPRSLVGATQGARSRLAKYLAWGDAATLNKPQGRRDLLAEWPTLTSQKGGPAARALRLAYHEQRQELRVGERLRPCPGCPDCTQDSDRLRRAIERPERVRHWGQTRTIVPRFLPTIIGDGKQWIVLVPLNTRPNYYVCRIDSSHSDDDPDAWLDDLYLALEDHFGRVDDGEEDGEECIGWPAVDLGRGSGWGTYEWVRCDGSGVIPARKRGRRG